MFGFYKKYTSINEALLRPGHVRVLYLTFTEPSEYEDKLPCLTSLKELFIHSNIAMRPVSDIIIKVPTLENLSMLNVNYKSFPEYLSLLPNLKYFRIRGCDFTIIPDTILQFKNLKVLAIENTDIAELPAIMKSMGHLLELSLIDNFSLVLNSNILPVNLKKLYITPTKANEEEVKRIKHSNKQLKIIYR